MLLTSIFLLAAFLFLLRIYAGYSVPATEPIIYAITTPADPIKNARARAGILLRT